MISDEALDALMQPIIDRQEDINTYVIETIAKRIKEIGTMSPANIKKLQLLVEMGADIRLINAELAKVTELNVRDIKAMIKTIAIDAYLDARPFYDYRHKSFIPFVENQKLQKIVTAVENVTANTYKNISNSKALGFMMQDPKHPNQLKFQSIKDTYQNAIDRAIQAVKTGMMDYNTAIRKTVNQLAASGVRRLYWDSGYTQRLDTAVRRNILDGVKAINMQIQEEIGKQINADGVELSAHINSAPDHEPFQGHVFTKEEFVKLQSGASFQDVNGVGFSGVERAIGMWNCRHFTRWIIIDAHTPKYTTKQLKKMIRDNAKGYTLSNGKHLTMYECTQRQRQLETLIRYAKESQTAFRASGDKQEAKRYQAKINRYLEDYKLFSKNCGLKTDMNRIRVNAYRRISV